MLAEDAIKAALADYKVKKDADVKKNQKNVDQLAVCFILRFIQMIFS